ncbi:divalent cation tolerance protein CutA [Okeania hirsuta]|uniref:divalent cation tolerance protein CutA n=1 Tax=Okeania hirsuta TaxID=1458930 RepID=UPI0035C9276B
MAKSLASKVPELIEKVKSAHSYSIPCVVSLPIKEGNPEYISWIGDELQIKSK